MFDNDTYGKIIGLDQISSFIEVPKREGKNIVHCHGVFDLLHIGHIRHFQQAKQLGHVLVVTITPDRYVNKGPGRPVFDEQLRAEAIAALDCVDFVSINNWPLAEEAIKIIKPRYYVKGSDYKDANDDLTGGIVREEAAVKSVGGELVFTDDITFSSSNLINQHLPIMSNELKTYVGDLANRYSSSDIVKLLQESQSLKVLTIGETIIDEYVYCETLGKSGKEPVLATRQVESERFSGGIVAVANHVAAFCDGVGLLSFLGNIDSHEDMVRENLNPEIDSTFLYMEGDSPTILKRRFVETYPFQKLFELYVMDSGESREKNTEALCEKLSELVPEYDVVLVTDYGHGMISSEVVDFLCKEARFLAVNTQVNAGNLGFNTVSKYKRADFLCVSENEIRLDARSRRKDLKDIVKDVSDRLSCERIIITKGANGCLCFGKDEGFFEVPAMATHVVDRIGAGDAVFAVATLCAAKAAPMEVVGFVGSLAGAQAVATVGHRTSVERIPLLRHMETLLK